MNIFKRLFSSSQPVDEPQNPPEALLKTVKAHEWQAHLQVLLNGISLMPDACELIYVNGGNRWESEAFAAHLAALQQGIQEKLNNPYVHIVMLSDVMSAMQSDPARQRYHMPWTTSNSDRPQHQADDNLLLQYVDNIHDCTFDDLRRPSLWHFCQWSARGYWYDVVMLPELQDGWTDEDIDRICSRLPALQVGPPLVDFENERAARKYFAKLKKDADKRARRRAAKDTPSIDDMDFSTIADDDIQDGEAFHSAEEEPELDYFHLQHRVDKRNFDSDTRKLLKETRERVRALTLRGVSRWFLDEYLFPQPVYSRLVITDNHRILLPDYDNMEIRMQPLTKAVYLLFLRHPEGIAFK